MARSHEHHRGSPRPAGRGKSTGGRPHKNWDRVCSDAERRVEIYQGTPAARLGCVYVMRDATGLVKVGYSVAAGSRLWGLQQLVREERRPVQFVRAVQMPRAIARRVERVAHWVLRADWRWRTTCVRTGSRKAGARCPTALRRSPALMWCARGLLWK